MAGDRVFVRCIAKEDVWEVFDNAGFHNIVVTSMGGDQIFLRCISKEDVWEVFNNAIDFFGMLFSNLHKWTTRDVGYERGAWLRVYGTPVHAWNTNFLKL